MSEEKIKNQLEQALNHDGEMEQELYKYELEEICNDLKSSMSEDEDEYIFAVTVNGGYVAMMLIEKSGQIYINEQAREKLKALWPAAYHHNMKRLIPEFAKQLNSGEIPINGVKTIEEP